MKQILYRTKHPTHINGHQFNMNELISVKEYHLVVGGTSMIRFTDMRGNYFSVTAKKFMSKFIQDEIQT